MSARWSIAINVACLLLLGWLYGGDLWDVSRARSSEAAAMTALPSVPYAIGVLLAAAVGAGLTALGAARGLDRSFRGYRVLPIVVVLGLFVDLFLVSAGDSPFPSFTRAAAALEQFAQRATELSSPAGVSVDAAALAPLLSDLGDPPWLARGEPVKQWTLERLTGCKGPRVERGAAKLGTVFYCVSEDRQRAFVTVVGLPREVRFGAPAVVTAGAEPLVSVVEARSSEAGGVASPVEAPPGAELFPPDDEKFRTLPMTFETDAGNL